MSGFNILQNIVMMCQQLLNFLGLREEVSPFSFLSEASALGFPVLFRGQEKQRLLSCLLIPEIVACAQEGILIPAWSASSGSSIPSSEDLPPTNHSDLASNACCIRHRKSISSASEKHSYTRFWWEKLLVFGQYEVIKNFKSVHCSLLEKDMHKSK